MDSTQKAIDVGFKIVKKKQIKLDKPKSFYKSKVDSLKLAILQSTIAINRKEREIEYLQNPETSSALYTSTSKSLKDQLEKHQESLSLLEYGLRWFTISGSLENRSFKLFDVSKTFEDQFSSSSFNEVSFGLRYNTYRFSDKSRYFNIGIDFINSDNLSSISSSKYDDTMQFVNQDSSITRNTISSSNAYKHKEYENDIFSAIAVGELYEFFKGNRMAFHTIQELEISTQSSGTFQQWHPTIGFLFAFKDDKTKQTSNLDLLFRIEDVFKNSNKFDDDDNILDQSSISLRFTFPFNIPFSQKN